MLIESAVFVLICSELKENFEFSNILLLTNCRDRLQIFATRKRYTPFSNKICLNKLTIKQISLLFRHQMRHHMKNLLDTNKPTPLRSEPCFKIFETILSERCCCLLHARRMFLPFSVLLCSSKSDFLSNRFLFKRIQLRAERNCFRSLAPEAFHSWAAFS